jgi:hypothetical protein
LSSARFEPVEWGNCREALEVQRHLNCYRITVIRRISEIPFRPTSRAK